MNAHFCSPKRLTLVLGVLLGSLPASLPAQLGDVTLTTVAGDRLQGTVDSITDSGQVRGPGLPPDLRLDSLLTILRQAPAEPEAAAVTVRTVGGGRVTGSEVTLADEQLILKTAAGPLPMSLQSVTGIIWTSSPLVQQSLDAPSRDNDRVVVNVNDQEQAVDGLLEGISAEGVTLNFQGRSRQISLDKVRAIVVADLDLAPAEGTQVLLQTTTGASWRGALLSLQGANLKLGLSREDAVTLPVAAVARIGIQSDRLRFLSDLQPVDAMQSVQFTVERSYRNDLSIAGNPLRIRSASGEGELTFEKGLGTQASSELVFANEGGFDRLRATVGIDLETGGRGHCDVIVRGDGIELWKQRISAEMAPAEVDVDISGLARISLIVQPGPEFDLADHLDWGNARFLKLD